MSAIRRWALLLVLCAPLWALAQGAVVKTAEVEAELVAHAPQGVAPGKPVWLGLILRHAPHWHTYWQNPGDSGLATALEWQLPAGVTAGAIEWPTPQRLPIGPLVNYGYEGTLLLAAPLAVAGDFDAAALDVSLRADWLVCREQCIPQSGEFRLRLPTQSPTVSDAAQFAAVRNALPRRLDGVSASAAVDGATLRLDLQGLPAAWRGKRLDFFAADAGVIDHAAPTAQQWDGDRLSLRVPLSAQRSESPATMQAVLALPGEAAGVALQFGVAGWPQVAATGAVPPATATSAGAADVPPAQPGGSPLALALVFAFGGGLLLNLMPCVFPVLSLKVLGFARHGAERRHLAAGGIAYTAGVMLSFVALAGLLLALRAAGEQLGWGFQLQSPPFVAALAVLFALIGLNLLGVFEVGNLLPGRLAAMRARHPVADHALTGVLAVAVASPCTAPFMGAALGVALTQPAPQALLVFAVLGAGMAAPYLAASLRPGLVRLLPLPGRWMAQLRTAMAFPMFATVVWLIWVLGQQVGIDGAAALLGALVALAFLAWARGAAGLQRAGRTALTALGLFAVMATGAWTWQALGQSAPGAELAAAADERTDATTWQRWSPEAQAQARAAGAPVFVDFTAAWCVTCQFNKRTALADRSLLDEFSVRKVRLLRADWTRRDAEITLELARLARTGVPVYALYAPGAREPQLLSEILTAAEVRAAMAAWLIGSPATARVAGGPDVPEPLVQGALR